MCKEDAQKEVDALKLQVRNDNIDNAQHAINKTTTLWAETEQQKAEACSQG